MYLTEDMARPTDKWFQFIDTIILYVCNTLHGHIKGRCRAIYVSYIALPRGQDIAGEGDFYLSFKLHYAL